MTGREYKAPHCCYFCRTPHMCANTECGCHVAFITAKRPTVGWKHWWEITTSISRSERLRRLQNPKEWQTRWFVNNIIRTNPVTGDLLNDVHPHH